MLFFLAYLAVRRLVRVFGEGSGVASLEVENALLRHQLAVLRRTVKRPPMRRKDRMLLAGRQHGAAAGALVGVLGLAADALAVAP